MPFALKISTTAYSEISAAIRWYEDTSGSFDVAKRWHQGLMQAIHSLLIDPERYVLASESDAFPFEVRELLYGSGRRKHIAFFSESMAPTWKFSTSATWRKTSFRPTIEWPIAVVKTESVTTTDTKSIRRE